MRVVPYSEALQIAQISPEQRFAEADTLARQLFGKLIERGVILGAFPFGSTQFSDETSQQPGFHPTSDYDMLVMRPDGDATDETAAFAQMHEAAKYIYDQTGVPLEIESFTINQLRNGFHTLDDGMVAWLREQRKQHPHNVLGIDFVQNLPWQERLASPEHLVDLDNFAHRTRHNLKKVWLRGASPDPTHTLGLVLSLPQIAGRKTMDVLIRVGAVKRKVLANLGRPAIAEAIYTVFGSESEIGALYADITHDLTLYERFVQEAPTLSEDQYAQMVESVLEINLPKAIELLRRMHEGCRDLANNEVYSGSRADTTTYTERGTNQPPDWFLKGHLDKILPGVDRDLIKHYLDNHPGQRFKLVAIPTPRRPLYGP